MESKTKCAKCGYEFCMSKENKCPRCGTIINNCKGCSGNCLKCNTGNKQHHALK